MQIRLEDHSAEVYKELEAACQRALEKCGLVAEGYAKKLCPVDTGNLRNSITHTVADNGERAAYVGTNSEYGVYVECGTGIYYPGGRQTPWVYQDEKGDWHLTHGQRAKPYIKPAVADHSAQYNRIIEQELKGK
jgi:HK97 gp10 family phage protein